MTQDNVRFSACFFIFSNASLMAFSHIFVVENQIQELVYRPMYRSATRYCIGVFFWTQYQLDRYILYCAMYGLGFSMEDSCFQKTVAPAVLPPTPTCHICCCHLSHSQSTLCLSSSHKATKSPRFSDHHGRALWLYGIENGTTTTYSVERSASTNNVAPIFILPRN